MKRILTYVLSAVFVPSLIAGDGLVAGRFQLVAAVTETISASGAFQHPQVFRIDTATGDVWLFSSWSDKKALHENWQPVKEDTVTGMVKALEAARRAGITNQTDLYRIMTIAMTNSP